MSPVLECRTEWDCLTKKNEKVSYVQSAKGEIESFRVGKAHWGKAVSSELRLGEFHWLSCGP